MRMVVLGIAAALAGLGLGSIVASFDTGLTTKVVIFGLAVMVCVVDGLKASGF